MTTAPTSASQGSAPARRARAPRRLRDEGDRIPNDFWAKPPKSVDAINYDGRSTGNQVWEVKTGFGWMFNPRCYDMALRTIAGWEVQRARGLAIARACAYVHMWSVTDPYVAAGLNARWGGSPPSSTSPSDRPRAVPAREVSGWSHTASAAPSPSSHARSTLPHTPSPSGAATPG